MLLLRVVIVEVQYETNTVLCVVALVVFFMSVVGIDKAMQCECNVE